MADSAKRKWFTWLAAGLLVAVGVVMLLFGTVYRLRMDREAREFRPVFEVKVIVIPGSDLFAMSASHVDEYRPVSRRFVWLFSAGGVALGGAFLLFCRRFSLRSLLLTVVGVGLVGSLPFLWPVRNSPAVLDIWFAGGKPLRDALARADRSLTIQSILSGPPKSIVGQMPSLSTGMFGYRQPGGQLLPYKQQLFLTDMPEEFETHLQYVFGEELSYDQQLLLSDFLVHHAVAQLAMDWLGQDPKASLGNRVEWLVLSGPGSALGSDWFRHRQQWWQEFRTTHRAKP